jgi:hypothetical protein
MDDPERQFLEFRRTGDPKALAQVFDRIAPELLLGAAHLTGRRQGPARRRARGPGPEHVPRRDHAERYDGVRPAGLPWEALAARALHGSPS